MSALSNLPSVEHLLQTRDVDELVQRHGRPLTLDALRQALDEIRAEFKLSSGSSAPGMQEILGRAQAHLSRWESLTLRPVINATGVILHTNLGRAPLSEATLGALGAVSSGYSNLEYDLESGKRGTRLRHAETLLQKLLGVEAALVVNNNAAALLLTLAALASKKAVVIARSQLVEIGGGFRVPDVMKQSGGRLHEVGTTNRVRISDYKEALAEGEGLVLHVHRSNFKMIGFTEEPSVGDLVQVAHAAERLLVEDLGSGALLDTAKYGLVHEPTVQESVAAGADVICFSGDKLLGGPQAGIIVGRARLLEKMKKHPLARAVRADKTCLAGVSATLLHYLRDEAEREIPIWRMISMKAEQARTRAEGWADELGCGSVEASESTVGGGSLPSENMPTYVLRLEPRRADRFLKTLRQQDPPIIARTEAGGVLVDARTVLVEQDALLVAGLRSAIQDDADQPSRVLKTTMR